MNLHLCSLMINQTECTCTLKRMRPWAQQDISECPCSMACIIIKGCPLQCASQLKISGFRQLSFVLLVFGMLDAPMSHDALA